MVATARRARGINRNCTDRATRERRADTVRPQWLRLQRRDAAL